MTTEQQLKDGIPCNHKGCLSHITHPCEGCGRVGGRYLITEQKLKDDCTPDMIFNMENN